MADQEKNHGFPTSRRRVLRAGAFGAGVLLAQGILGTRKAAAATTQETTADRIKRTGIFNLGVREADPPYGFLDKGKHIGFSTEVAERVHQRLEREFKTAIKINYVAVTGRTRIPLLLNGTIDMEAGATVITKDRVKVVDFSIPFFLTASYLLVPAESPIKRLADLSGKRLGGPRGGLQEMLVTRKLQKEGVFKSPVRFIGFETPSEGLTALQGGSVDAYTNDAPIIYGLVKSTPDPAKWRAFDPAMDASPQAFPLRQYSSSFATLINLTIVDLCETGGWLELYQKYFVPVGLPKEPDETSRFLVRMNSWSD
ncbi:MAG TPA: transporter substrate-binding domain-containing protein [Candidatus Methylomirabilis sp.]|nr:transporter substrate-binding domain-containing protein [Candidatus Methylomirabilis sp.]